MTSKKLVWNQFQNAGICTVLMMWKWDKEVFIRCVINWECVQRLERMCWIKNMTMPAKEQKKLFEVEKLTQGTAESLSKERWRKQFFSRFVAKKNTHRKHKNQPNVATGLHRTYY